MDIVGKVELNDSSQCVFYVEEFRGKKFGSIRKFVESEAYSGPTKSGVVLNTDGIDELVALLGGLLKQTGKLQDKEVGKVQVQDGKFIAVNITTYREEQGLDIREYVDTEDYSGPTKKGIRLPVDAVKDAVGYLKTMKEKLVKA